MKHTQRGMTLLEILAAIAVGALLFAGLTDMINVSLEDARGQQAAHHQAQVVNAAQKYIAANYQSLVAGSASAPVPVTVTKLKTDGFLSSSFADTNSYNQSTCVLVRQPSLEKLDALVVTQGGQMIPDRSIAAVAMMAGQGAGYITSVNTGVARGASWRLNDTTPYRSVPCSGGGAPVLTGGVADGGHLVSSLFYDGPGQLRTDFLYRDPVPGRPELNGMNTPLRMASGALVTAGTPCGAEVALAVESNTRSVLVCGQNGVWTNASTWKDPVASHAALNATPGRAGDVRVALGTKRAYAYTDVNDGSWGPVTNTNWVPLALDANGDMWVPNDIRIGRSADIANDLDVWSNMDVHAYSVFHDQVDFRGDANARSGFTISGGMLYIHKSVNSTLEGKLWVQNGIDVDDGLDVDGGLSASGQIKTTDNRVMGLTLRPSSVGSPGESCTSQASIIASNSGLPLFCMVVGGGHQYRYANGKVTPN
ncbi:MAG: hypothetical protein V7642_677 [Burkholderiales bacterium]|jgi:prepilin-type N-terminal cleavage/methylation domain-containing protein